MSRLPFSDAFPYTLVVEDSRDEDHIDTDFPNKTRGWAKLIRTTSTGGTLEYIQEKTTPYARRNPDAEDATVGWEHDPSVLWDFIEMLRDDYYEANVDETDELPLRILTVRKDDPDHEWWGYDEYCEVYVCDPEGGEYVMWNTQELYARDPDTVETPCNSELIQKVLVTVARVYEEPQVVFDRFEGHRTQME